MDKETAIKLFEDKRVRVLWDEDLEKWFFSIIDVVGVLSESDNPRKYWSVLKTRLKAEGSQLATNCSRFTPFLFQPCFQHTPIFSRILTFG